MFRKGDKKPLGSGRKKGQICKLAATVRQRLEELGCDPILGLATIAMDEEEGSDVRTKANSELMKYCYPQRKAIELSGLDGGDIGVHLTVSAADILRSRIAGIAERKRTGGGP